VANKKQDMDLLSRYLADEYRGWLFNSPAPMTKEEARPWYERRLQKVKQVLNHFHAFDIDIYGDMAVVFSVSSIVNEHEDGSETSITFKSLDVFHKIDGRWLIVAEGASVEERK